MIVTRAAGEAFLAVEARADDGDTVDGEKGKKKTRSNKTEEI